MEDQGELRCHEAAGSGKLSSGAPPPALPNLANIRLTASHLGACGGNGASQAVVMSSVYPHGT